MPLFGGSSSSVRQSGPLGGVLGQRIPVSIYPREMNQGIHTGSPAQLGASVLDGGTAVHRQRTNITWGCSDVALLFANYKNINGAGETGSTATLTVSATVEYPADTFYTVLFNGQSSVTISPNQTVVSDPLPLYIPANTVFYTRTFMTVPAPAQVSPGYPVGPNAGTDPLVIDATTCGDNHFVNNGNGSNQMTTAGRAWISSSNSYSYGPLAVIGTPAGGNATYRPVVGIIGDSIGDFSLDHPDGGFLARTLISASIPYYRLARGNESQYNFQVASQRFNRMLRIAQCSTIIYQYGTNDLVTNMPFATFKTNLLACCLAAGSYGATIWLVTIVPRTTSTDGYITTVNQTVVSGNSSGYNTVRQLINSYYRAPASAGAGNSAAYDLAAQGTKFGGYIDLASCVETTSGGPMPVFGTIIPGADRYYATGTVAWTDGVHPVLAIHQQLATTVGLVPTSQFT